MFLPRLYPMVLTFLIFPGLHFRRCQDSQHCDIKRGIEPGPAFQHPTVKRVMIGLTVLSHPTVKRVMTVLTVLVYGPSLWRVCVTFLHGSPSLFSRCAHSSLPPSFTVVHILLLSHTVVHILLLSQPGIKPGGTQPGIKPGGT